MSVFRDIGSGRTANVFGAEEPLPPAWWGTFSRGDRFTTEPYVSGAAYIDRMSDDCGDFRVAPKKDGPITSLYWDFLARNTKTLDGSPRMAMPLRSLEKRAPETRASDARVRRWVVERLREGHPLDPEDRP
jgi:deoxyribodipyrimidine photolyase-like uncharacterized protein